MTTTLGLRLSIPLHRVRSARVRFQAQPPPQPPPDKPMRIARMLAMAHVIAAQVAAGDLPDLQSAACAYRVTRARMSQLIDLTLLAPDIQEQVLSLRQSGGDDRVSEHDLRALIRSARGLWSAQRAAWHDLLTRRGLA